MAPARRYGQHFLTDRSLLGRIAAAVAPGGSPVIEAGPGLGALTEELLATGVTVIGVEVDARLVEPLRRRFAGNDRFKLLHADVLALSPSEMLAAGGLAPDAPYVMAGNLPYNAGAAIVRHFLEAAQPPLRAVVMLQREVAAAMTAGPGDLGLLGVATQVFAQPRRLFNVPPGAFYPPPKVTSTVILLEVRATPLVPADERDHFFEVVRAGFGTPRKQVHNALATGLGLRAETIAAALAAASIDGRRRPGELAIEEWRRLAPALPAGVR